MTGRYGQVLMRSRHILLLSPVLFSCACILRFINSCGVSLGPLEVEAEADAAAEDLPTGVRESYKNKKRQHGYSQPLQ